jgi:cytochrome P450
MSTQTEHQSPPLECPVAWPQPGEGYGIGQPAFFDQQLGAWVVSAFADVERILHDPTSFSSKWVTGPYRATAFAPMMASFARDPRAATAMIYFHIGLIDSDGDVHARERSFVARIFTPRRVRAFEPTMRELSEELTDSILGRTGVPFVQEFAVPLPVKVIAQGLGLQPTDYLDLKRWSDGFQRPIGTPEPTPEAIEEFLTASTEFTDYVTPIIEERRREPTGDIISILAAENEAGERLNNAEILSMCAALLLAGNETSTAALGGTLLYLMRASGLQDQVRADPSLVPALVEEGLRLTTPAQVLFRTATVDVEVAGVKIAKGDHVLLRFAAANRDDKRFETPLTPCLDRADKRHLTFGRGLHTCLGAPLARAEIRIAFETLLARTSSITLSDREDAVVPAGNEMTAGVGELYIDVSA